MSIRMATAGEKTMSVLDLLHTIGSATPGTRMRARHSLGGRWVGKEFEIPADTLMEVREAHGTSIYVCCDIGGQLKPASIHCDQFHLLEIVTKP